MGKILMLTHTFQLGRFNHQLAKWFKGFVSWFYVQGVKSCAFPDRSHQLGCRSWILWLLWAGKIAHQVITTYNLHLTFCCIIGVEYSQCILFFEVASLTKLHTSYDNMWTMCVAYLDEQWPANCVVTNPGGLLESTIFLDPWSSNLTRISTAPLRLVKHDEKFYCLFWATNSLKLRAKAPDMKMVGRWSFLFEMAYSLEVQNSFKKSPSWKESSYLSIIFLGAMLNVRGVFSESFWLVSGRGIVLCLFRGWCTAHASLWCNRFHCSFLEQKG